MFFYCIYYLLFCCFAGRLRFVVAYHFVKVHHFHQEGWGQGVLFLFFQQAVQPQYVGHGGIAVAKGFIGIVVHSCHTQRGVLFLIIALGKTVGVVGAAKGVVFTFYCSGIWVKANRNIIQGEVVVHTNRMALRYIWAKISKMLRIGLIKERKTPPDTRVALTPKQCAHICDQYPGITIVAEPSETRCYSNDEYRAEGITITDDLGSCHILLGIKEVPVANLISGKTYFFFSHTKKKQPYNKGLMQALIQKGIRMVDYECLTHTDEQRILGFGLYAGIVGAHNGLLAYGKKTGLYELPKAQKAGSYDAVLASYELLKLPNIKIAITGSGKVAAGIIDVMTQLDIEPVEPLDFLTHQYEYPVYTHLKGNALYARKDNNMFQRDDFHANPKAYKCLFTAFVNQADILMNGVYWDEDIARLFEKTDIARNDWRIGVIADITCDVDGSVPINMGATTIAEPVYGVERKTGQKTAPYMQGNTTIDVMAVDNLPNELPRDASQYFGMHLEKYVIEELLKDGSDIINRATICEGGGLTKGFEYLSDYAF